MDYSATSFPDNHFDAIYTTETLSHSPDIRKTLQEFFRILKPGGKIALFEYTLAPDEKFSEWEKKMLDVVIEGSAMMGLKDFRHDQFTGVVKDARFENAKERNITENIRPSFYRLHKLSRFPYKFIKFLGLQKFFINTTAGYEYYKMADKGLFRYCIFTGNKPKEFAAKPACRQAGKNLLVRHSPKGVGGKSSFLLPLPAFTQEFRSGRQGEAGGSGVWEEFRPPYKFWAKKFDKLILIVYTTFVSRIYQLLFELKKS